ncbi:carbohydrate-binding module family 18 protein [Xylariaceae sp. FL1651]|nr:carbohydrate-binding module family 18 protein [Xylariaceae sp. FL1651]
MMRLIYTPSLVSTLCCIVAATFNVASKTNVVVHYQLTFLSFVHLFPQQANGYPGINFGNQCSGDRYPRPGYGGNRDASKDMLLKCPNMQKDLYTRRQTSTKKILLSLGGGISTSWTSAGLPRPFEYDDPASRTFHPSTNSSAGYKASGSYYLTASPQGIVPDANIGGMLKAAAFDMVFADANPNYVPGGPSNNAGFTTQYSKNARVFIGLPGSSAAANLGFDLSTAQTCFIAEVHYCKPNFGSIAVWEAMLSCIETLSQSTNARYKNGFGTTYGNTICCSRWG